MPRPKLHIPHPILLWKAACVLLALGVVSTFPDLMQVQQQEVRLANSFNQRVVIDAKTGVVAGIFVPPSLASTFEVAAPTNAAPDTAEAAPSQNSPETPESPPEETAPQAETSAPNPLDALPQLRTEAKPFTIPPAREKEESIVLPPAPEVTEWVNKLPLPAILKDGPTPATIYGKWMPRLPDHPYVAILLTDVGMNSEVLSAIMGLPRTVTIALSPYAIEGDKQITRLHQAGFETWGMLPTTTSLYPQADPGPWGLIASLPEKDFKERMHRILSATLGAAGMVLPPDETLSDTPEAFIHISQEIQQRGLYVLLTHPTRSVSQLIPDAKQQKSARRAHWVLEETMTESEIASKLAGVHDEALAKKKLIITLQARPKLIAQLSEWLASKPFDEEVTLAPLSLFYRPAEQPKEPAKEEKKSHGGGH